jgi:hypothetical protein
MLTAQATATRVIDNIENEKIKVGFVDPASIMLIISIIGVIINGIRLYCEWKHNQNIPTEAKKTSVSKPYVRRIVRKHLKRERYKTDGNTVVNAIIKTGQLMTPEESDELLSQTPETA